MDEGYLYTIYLYNCATFKSGHSSTLPSVASLVVYCLAYKQSSIHQIRTTQNRKNDGSAQNYFMGLYYKIFHRPQEYAVIA